MTPGFTTHELSHGRKQKRTLNIPVSPWEISDTYSKLQMSAIVLRGKKKKPKLNFWGKDFSGQLSRVNTAWQGLYSKIDRR